MGQAAKSRRPGLQGNRDLRELGHSNAQEAWFLEASFQGINSGPLGAHSGPKARKLLTRR